MLRVVFVCSGNICRSPMAHAVFEREAQKRRIPHVVVSMGTLGIVGHRAADFAIDACDAIGVDLHNHRSQPISRQILRHATHIFIMERAHKAALERLGIEDESVQYLGVWDPQDPRPEIADPVDQDRAFFDASLRRIVRSVEHFLTVQSAP